MNQQRQIDFNQPIVSEIWKDVKGFEGFYQVSDIGNVKRLETYIKHPKKGMKIVRERVLKLCFSSGYSMVMLTVNNSRDNRLVHRLVGEAFVLNENNKPHVNHLNGIKHDNRVSNLEWCTAKENEYHKAHVLQKINSTINLSNVDSVAEPMMINGRCTVGVKLQRLYNDLKAGKSIKSTDKQYGQLYGQLSRLRVAFSVNIERRHIGKGFQEWFLNVA